MVLPRSMALALAALLAAPALAASDFPTLKSGQWEMTTTSSNAPANPRKTVVCLDASTQKSLLDMSQGLQKEMCKKMDMRRDGTRYVTESECRIGESTIRSRGVMTMISDTAYRTEATATFDPPLAKDIRESKTVVDGKFVGACRDGLQPGDMLLPNGQKISLQQMQQLQQGQPPSRPPAAKPKTQ